MMCSDQRRLHFRTNGGVDRAALVVLVLVDGVGALVGVHVAAR